MHVQTFPRLRLASASLSFSQTPSFNCDNFLTCTENDMCNILICILIPAWNATHNATSKCIWANCLFKYRKKSMKARLSSAMLFFSSASCFSLSLLYSALSSNRLSWRNSSLCFRSSSLSFNSVLFCIMALMSTLFFFVDGVVSNSVKGNMVDSLIIGRIAEKKLFWHLFSCILFQKLRRNEHYSWAWLKNVQPANIVVLKSVLFVKIIGTAFDNHTII